MTTTKIIVKFPSLECEQRAFEVLSGTGLKFSYVGNRNVEVTQTQIRALDVQGVPYNIQK